MSCSEEDLNGFIIEFERKPNVIRIRPTQNNDQTVFESNIHVRAHTVAGILRLTSEI